MKNYRMVFKSSDRLQQSLIRTLWTFKVFIIFVYLFTPAIYLFIFIFFNFSSSISGNVFQCVSFPNGRRNTLRSSTLSFILIITNRYQSFLYARQQRVGEL